MKKLLMIVAILSLGLVACNETTEGEVVATDSTSVTVTPVVTTESVTVTLDSTVVEVEVDSTIVE